MFILCYVCCFFFCKQKTAYEMRISDWSSDVCSSDLINCAHCHSLTGPARVSGLWLDSANADPRALGVCKPPVAAGKGAEGRAFDIVPGDAPGSVLSHRIAITDPGAMMPTTGRSLTRAARFALHTPGTPTPKDTH